MGDVTDDPRMLELGQELRLTQKAINVSVMATSRYTGWCAEIAYSAMNPAASTATKSSASVIQKDAVSQATASAMPCSQTYVRIFRRKPSKSSRIGVATDTGALAVSVDISKTQCS